MRAAVPQEPARRRVEHAGRRRRHGQPARSAAAAASRRGGGEAGDARLGGAGAGERGARAAARVRLGAPCKLPRTHKAVRVGVVACSHPRVQGRGVAGKRALCKGRGLVNGGAGGVRGEACEASGLRVEHRNALLARRHLVHTHRAAARHHESGLAREGGAARVHTALEEAENGAGADGGANEMDRERRERRVGRHRRQRADRHLADRHARVRSVAVRLKQRKGGVGRGARHSHSDSAPACADAKRSIGAIPFGVVRVRLRDGRRRRERAHPSDWRDPTAGVKGDGRCLARDEARVAAGEAEREANVWVVALRRLDRVPWQRHADAHSHKGDHNHEEDEDTPLLPVRGDGPQELDVGLQRILAAKRAGILGRLGRPRPAAGIRRDALRLVGLARGHNDSRRVRNKRQVEYM